MLPLERLTERSLGRRERQGCWNEKADRQAMCSILYWKSSLFASSAQHHMDYFRHHDSTRLLF
jgi:hypothetical protein